MNQMNNPGYLKNPGLFVTCISYKYLILIRFFNLNNISESGWFD